MHAVPALVPPNDDARAVALAQRVASSAVVAQHVHDAALVAAREEDAGRALDLADEPPCSAASSGGCGAISRRARR